MTEPAISKENAARILFASDRTCCVCRIRGRPVQLHHIDENNLNNDPSNIAVLCFDCHRDTQIVGGFDRKLDAHQIIHYRDDWIKRVHNRRSIDHGPVEIGSQLSCRYLTGLSDHTVYRSLNGILESHQACMRVIST